MYKASCCYFTNSNLWPGDWPPCQSCLCSSSIVTGGKDSLMSINLGRGFWLLELTVWYVRHWWSTVRSREQTIALYADHDDYFVSASLSENIFSLPTRNAWCWIDVICLLYITATVDITAQRRQDLLSAPGVGHTIVTDPTVRQSGFELPCRAWFLAGSPQNRSRSISCGSAPS